MPLCPLRECSPLPLAAHGHPDLRPHTALENRRRGWTPERRVRQSETSNARWSRPGERERQSARSIAMHEAMTPEEKADFGARINVGKRKSA